MVPFTRGRTFIPLGNIVVHTLNVIMYLFDFNSGPIMAPEACLILMFEMISTDLKLLF